MIELIVSVFKKSNHKAPESELFGEVELTDGDLETGEEFYLSSTDQRKQIAVLFVQAAERNPEYKRQRSLVEARRTEPSIDDLLAAIPAPSISPRSKLQRLSQAPLSLDRGRSRSLVQDVAIAAQLRQQSRTNVSGSSGSAGSSSTIGSGSSPLVSSGIAARRRRGLKPLLRAAVSFRDFQITTKIWDGVRMREDEAPDRVPELALHDLVLFVAAGEPIQSFVPPMPVRVIILSWNQDTMNMEAVWYFSFEIVIIWFVASS